MKGKVISIEEYNKLKNYVALLEKATSNSLPILDIDNNRWIRRLVDVPEGYKVDIVKEKV